jgi:hypothetical protein
MEVLTVRDALLQEMSCERGANLAIRRNAVYLQHVMNLLPQADPLMAECPDALLHDFHK